VPRNRSRDPAPSVAAWPVDPTSRRWALGAADGPVRSRLASWSASDTVGRVWRKDPALWPLAPPSDVAGRLGWLRAPEQGAARVDELRAFAEEAVADGIEQVVLLGMGGSSLAAEVIAGILPHAKSRPELSVLDSTHPDAVRAYAERVRTDRTLFLVSSKSGTTLEPNAFFRFFWERAGKQAPKPGRQFVAITDPGTPLEQLASERGFRACFAAPADVGGRYSALTVFGLVPAALVGADLAGLLASARTMVARCADTAHPETNPGLRLAAALGELARGGRDKVVFLTSRSLRPFPSWAEQLVAESLGKLGRGIVPVVGTPTRGGLPRGEDVVFVHLAMDGETDRPLERELEEREAAGAPVLRFGLASPLELGREFFRWEFAIALCGSVLEVDPFDQPDVEHAKELARQAMGRPGGKVRAAGDYGLHFGAQRPAEVERWLASARPADYVAVQAFLAPDEATDAALARLASQLRARLGTVVTIGYGPRFLHSTGQLHKGGPPSGLFLQVVDDPVQDLAVPELGLTFGEIVRAQASGDRGALEEKQRRLLVVNVGPRPRDGLARLSRFLAPRAGRLPSAA
jgi:transaldolase / glucose-6-phosphate isomerase